MDNIEKRSKYANLMYKLKKATDYEFYYEAIFIEYAILEDRTESLLRHSNTKIPDRLCRKLDKIENKYVNVKDKYLNKHLTQELINEIREFKFSRDRLIHNLVECPYDYETIKNTAIYGEALVKKVNSKFKLVNNYFDKQLQNKEAI